jgi:hypothetical protein
MRVGAKIMLNTEVGAARDRLAGLADGGWLMSRPRQRDRYRGHPAGSARPALASPGGTDLIAVMFGALPPPAGPTAVLPVRWERLEPGDECAVLIMDGDIALAPLLGHAGSTLTLGGTCRMLPAVLIDDGHEQARLRVIETARAFIASVADILADSPDSAQQLTGPAWSWLTGEPQTP